MGNIFSKKDENQEVLDVGEEMTDQEKLELKNLENDEKLIEDNHMKDPIFKTLTEEFHVDQIITS